jgi:hypothetical protein
MSPRFKKVAVIMLVCLLAAVPLIQVHNAFAAGEMEGAKMMNDKAASMLNDMMMKMDAMMKQPMSANEKQMMQMMHQMAELMKMLIDVNKQLIASAEKR